MFADESNVLLDAIAQPGLGETDNLLNSTVSSDTELQFKAIAQQSRQDKGTSELDRLNLNNLSSNASEIKGDDITGILGDSPLAGIIDRSSLDPDISQLPGLDNPIAIERDTSGVPHIQALNTEDALFGQGYVHAEDRLWQMELQRRLVSGTLSEVFGADTLDSDKAYRTRGLNQLAATGYQNLTPEAKGVVDAYTAGVNAYLSNDPELPPEFQTLGYQPKAWQPTDVLLATQLATSIGVTNGDELIRAQLLEQGVSRDRISELINSYPEDATTILQPEDIQAKQGLQRAIDKLPQEQSLKTEMKQDVESLFSNSIEASNNWVVSGDRTTTGKPFLANDPHLPLQQPSYWYQSHLSTPQTDVIGGSFPGIPGILTGRNQDIAWGVTALQVDGEDYYQLEETQDGSGYTYRGEVRPYQIREETIKVKGADSESLSVKESVYGPVVSDSLGLSQPVALESIALEPVDGAIESFIGINRAQNWQEFKGAIDFDDAAAAQNQNFVYADVDGNIGYIAAGKFPIRQPGHSGGYPVPGTGEFDWKGFIPFEEAPQVYNPKSGFIVTANNKITPANYPYEINGSFADPYRAERIRELILAKDKLSLEDMQAIQLDQVSLLYRDFRPILQQLQPTSEQGQTWRDRLLAWDGNTTPDSVEASVFAAWYTELTKLPAQEVGREYFDRPIYLSRAILDGDPALNRPGSAPGLDDEAAQALENALTRLGDNVPAWGDLHQARFEPLNQIQESANLQVPYGGDGSTVNVGPYDPEDFSMDFGPSYRQIVDLGDPENSLYVNPPGQSSDLDSDNFDDQLPLWQRGDYLPMKTEDYAIAQLSVLLPERSES
jgi:penicillin G amidase